LPKEVEDLLAIAAIRHAAHMLGIARLDAGPDAIALTFREERLRRPPAPSMPEEPHQWRDGRLIIEIESTPERRLETVEALLEELAG
jgi:transcription-repair coupling factor (superfamily II helicase)